MKEEFLHHIWKTKLFSSEKLKTTDGEALQIIKVGELNTDAGPDFINARIKIADETWAGNIEIHIRSSDFFKHAHEIDSNYDNLILHVVFENDVDIKRKDGTVIPAMELKNLIGADTIAKYENLTFSTAKIPCSNLIQQVDDFTKQQMIERCGIERLQQKTEIIFTELEQNKNNWEETFYRLLAKSFGAKINAEAFQLLAKSLPLSVLAKHKNNLFQIESLLFGVAGMLNDKFVDVYPNEMKKEFDFLQKKYNLISVQSHAWKYFRLRPANFPTIRIAQFASLIFKSTHLFSKIIQVETVKELQNFFQAEVSDYWKTHYTFDKLSEDKNKPVGNNFIDLILINTVVPLVFAYGKWKDEDGFQNKSIGWLEKLTPESNTIIKNFEALGMKTKNAFDSQALIQLNNNYCAKQLCLHCTIGHNILRN